MTQSGKAGKVRIVGENFRIILHRKRSDMSIRDEIRSSAYNVKVSLQNIQVVGAGIQWSDVGVFEPLLYIRSSLGQRQWQGQNTAARYKSYKPY